MANLIYVANTSLDGYTEDKDGKFDWTEPSEEYFRFITNVIRATRTHLYGHHEGVGDGSQLSRGVSTQARLRRDLASSGQNRVLQDVRDCIHSQNAACANVRSGSDSTTESDRRA